MQKINHVVNELNIENYNKNPPNVTAIDEERTKKVLNRLFTRLERIFPKFWVNIKSQEHLNGIKEEWFECFQREGLSDTRQIVTGIKMAKKSHLEYLPKASLFINWCTQPDAELLGFPDNNTAYMHSIKINSQFSDYKHPDPEVDKLLRHAIKQIGAFQYRSMSDINARKTFEAYYSKALKDYFSGNMKDIPQMLEDNSAITKEESIKKAVIKEEYKGIGKESALSAMKKLLK